MAGKNSQVTNAVATAPKDNVEARKVDGTDSLSVNKSKTEQDQTANLTVFGSYLFNSQNLTFEPKLNIPTPPKYILGTYDELVIDISGLYEANYKLKVSSEGLIRIPNVGPIKVAGISVEDASRMIKNQVSKVYMGVSSGETRVNVTLGNIRSIRVTIVGEAVRPGTYTLPSLATAFNALYACGGPNDIGSMRDIKVIRAGKTIAKLDVYQFLVEGVLVNNIALQDEDILKIDPYKIQVVLNGAVKHPAIFQGIQGETLQSLVHFAGGFADNANKSKVTVFRLTEKGRTVIDVLDKNISTFILKSGDSCCVTKTYNKFDNRVDIRGSIYRPGAYAIEPGLTVKQLIAKADGIKEDAYLNMAYITRKKENQIPQIIGFNLGELLNGTASDILLQKDDQIEIRSLFDFREGQSVSILGEVKSPGTFPLIENITLKDLIFKAKGFTEMASTDSVELVRVIKDQETLLTTNKKSTVQKFALDKDLNFKNGDGDILLENGDQVIVRSISGYEGIRMVRVEGEVIHPGSYNITNKAERISDVVKRSGGFTNYAYPSGAFLIRSESTNGIEQKLNKMMQDNSKNQLENQPNKSLDANMLKAAGATTVQGYTAMDSIQKKLSGSSVVDKIFVPEGVVGLDMKEIMKQPGGKYDLKLEVGDIIYIPRELQTVRVLGQVLFPTIVRYDKGMCMSDYISNSGGFSLNANRYKVFVLYANGSAKSTKSFLGFRIYPKIEPGTRIVVPEKPIEIKNKLTTAETVALLTSISSVVALMYSILR
jgi:protein involved in polysaccharide export with SLBB domain